MGMYNREMTFPVLLPYATIRVTLNPCKVPLPLCTSATTRVRLIRLRVAKAVNRVMNSKRYVLQLPLSPRLAECLHTRPNEGKVRDAACTGAAICDNVFIVAPLAEGLALAAELKAGS